MRRLALLCGLALTPPALGQAGWIITTEYQPGHTSVNPLAPTARIRISAFFSPPDFAFAAGRWDFWSDDSTWNYARQVAPFSACGPPWISGSLVNACGGQVHFPPQLPANPANPAWVMDAQWVTADFRARTVRVTTLTMRFDVFTSPSTPASASRLGVLAEGHGEIRVTPAPPAAVILVATGIVIQRRRSKRCGSLRLSFWQWPGPRARRSAGS